MYTPKEIIEMYLWWKIMFSQKENHGGSHGVHVQEIKITSIPAWILVMKLMTLV